MSVVDWGRRYMGVIVMSMLCDLDGLGDGWHGYVVHWGMVYMGVVGMGLLCDQGCIYGDGWHEYVV